MPVVTGIERFRDAMAAHDDEYVLIGGGACSLLFDDAGMPFRATKDLDIVILTEADGGSAFARDFWAFIQSGGYACWKRAEDRCVYYRFNLPANSTDAVRLPQQIELFSRHPNFALENENSEVAPLPFNEDISSLSAIILDDGYYDFIRSHVEKINGVPLLDALHIIPLKMRAHVDLTNKHNMGRHVNDKDLSKHRSDVSKLSRLLPTEASLVLVGKMRADAEAFFNDFEQYIDRQTNRKQRRALEEDLAVLKRTYLGA